MANKRASPRKDEGRTWDRNYADAVIEELCERLRSGDSLMAVCADKRMPGLRTIYDWMDRDDELARTITRAREVGYFARGERAVEAARTATDAQLGRLAFDAERWFLGKISKAFKDKVVHAGDRDDPIQHEHKIDLSGAPKSVLEWLASQDDETQS